jgi:hypothetical protein
MRRSALALLAVLLGTTGPASAYDPPYIWVGQMVFVELKDCGGGATAAVNIVFRPKLEAGEDNSALSYQFLGAASGTVRKISDGLQLNGTGKYEGTFVTGFVQTRTSKGTFELDVRPEVVTPMTDFVRFTGTFTNFAGVDGCTAKVRGAAVRHP